MDTIYVDGSVTPVRCAYCLHWEKSGKHIVKEVKPAHTNNQMEYLAVIAALDQCKRGDTIKTDSMLVVGQVLKGWAVNVPHLVSLRNTVQDLLRDRKATLVWIQREQNLAGKEFEK